MYVLQLETELAVERRNHEDKRRRLKRRGKEAEAARRRLQQENALLNEQLAVSNERLGVLQRLKEGRRFCIRLMCCSCILFLLAVLEERSGRRNLALLVLAHEQQGIRTVTRWCHAQDTVDGYI